MQITLKNSTKKEPLISQKSLFYAVFLKFFHCQHRCLLHIKFHQIVLRMAYSRQTIRLFRIPFARFPYHSQHWHTTDLKFPILRVIFSTRKHSASFLAHACTTNPRFSGLNKNLIYFGSPNATIVE